MKNNAIPHETDVLVSARMNAENYVNWNKVFEYAK